MSTNPNVSLQTGTLLHQKYRIQKAVAEGGMGRIYEATNTQDGSKVAVKQLISKPDCDNTEIVERFRREYYFLNSINHPNLVKAYELISEAGQLFLVLEYAQGISLKTLIQDHAYTLSLLEQVAIGNQIARAIEVLNTAGIIHRDIKPDNIMINMANGQVKLLDLGLGKALGKESWLLTQRGSVMGTMEYLSPEQANGEISERSDIFSLGLTLYQFFLWEPHSPFKKENSVATMMEIMTKELPSLQDEVQRKYEEMGWELVEEDKKHYESLTQLLAKALAKEPEERISAGHLADELEKLYFELQSAQKENTPSTNWKIISRAGTYEMRVLQQLGEKYGRDRVKERSSRRQKRAAEEGGRAPRREARPSVQNANIATVVLLVLMVLVVGWHFFSQQRTHDNLLAAAKENQKLVDAEKKSAQILQQWRDTVEIKDKALQKYQENEKKLALTIQVLQEKLEGKDRALQELRTHSFQWSTKDYISKLLEISQQALQSGFATKEFWYRLQKDSYVAKQDYPNALQMYEKIIPVTAQDEVWQVYMERAQLHTRLKNYAQASEDCRKAVELARYDSQKKFCEAQSRNVQRKLEYEKKK